MLQELNYLIGLTLIKGIGPINAKKLVAYCGGVEAVFKENAKALEKIPNIGPALIKQITSSRILKKAQNEITFIEKNNLTCYSFWDKRYPKKLKECIDAPILLFSKGNTNFSNTRVISVVGTRLATSYGLSFCKEFFSDLKEYNPLVVSGLAYGIDKYAHKEALNNRLQTVGVLAHGLDTLYPKLNKPLAQHMLINGGLLTEFLSGTNLIKENFVRRNRIIAGISDATIVVQSDLKGGAMITAHMANSYNREVFALPSNYKDKHSKGCHQLIKSHQAHLMTSAKDLLDSLSWNSKIKPQQKTLFEHTQEEKDLIKLISKYDGIHIDVIHSLSQLSRQSLAETLMKLELEGVISKKPGNLFVT